MEIEKFGLLNKMMGKKPVNKTPEIDASKKKRIQGNTPEINRRLCNATRCTRLSVPGIDLPKMEIRTFSFGKKEKLRAFERFVEQDSLCGFTPRAQFHSVC